MSIHQRTDVFSLGRLRRQHSPQRVYEICVFEFVWCRSHAITFQKGAQRAVEIMGSSVPPSTNITDYFFPPTKLHAYTRRCAWYTAYRILKRIACLNSIRRGRLALALERHVAGVRSHTLYTHAHVIHTRTRMRERSRERSRER